jgi:hypothetical protein
MREERARSSATTAITRPAIVSLAAAILTLAWPDWVNAAENEQIQQILRDWSERRKAPSNIVYHLNGTVIYPKGGLTSPNDPDAHKLIRTGYPESDLSFPTKTSILLGLKDRRVRREDIGPVVNIVKPQITSRAESLLFDGQNTYTIIPKGEAFPPVLDYDAGDQVVKRHGCAPFLFTVESCPILFAHGIVGQDNPCSDFQAYEAPKAETFQFFGTGSIGESECAIFRMTKGRKVEEIWVDLAKKSAIVRWKVSRGDKLKYQHEIVYKQNASFWLPARWEYDNFEAYGSQPVRVSQRITVDAIESEPAVTDADYSPNLRPKTLLRDSSSNKQFIVDSSGELRPRDKNQERAAHWRPLVFASLAALILILMSIWIFRRRFRRRVA